jgi:hypothetical protein
MLRCRQSNRRRCTRRPRGPGPTTRRTPINSSSGHVQELEIQHMLQPAGHRRLRHLSAQLAPTSAAAAGPAAASPLHAPPTQLTLGGGEVRPPQLGLLADSSGLSDGALRESFEANGYLIAVGGGVIKRRASSATVCANIHTMTAVIEHAPRKLALTT